MFLKIRYVRVRSKLHVVKTPCPHTFFESEALGPGITFIFDESGWSAESRARLLGFIEDEHLVLAPAAQALQINLKSGAFLHRNNVKPKQNKIYRKKKKLKNFT